MVASVQRATVFAVKKETTVGSLISPSAGTSFVPLRTGFSLSSTFDELASDELVNDIGATKGSVGKETPSGSHPFYMKHSEVEGQEPNYGIMIESCMGGKVAHATEYDTTAASSTTVLKMPGGEGANFEEGQAVLIKDAVNGYSIRNIESISTDDLTLSFATTIATPTNVNLGKAIHYKPAATGHPSYSVFAYRANGAVKEAIAGCRTTAMNLTAASGQFLEGTFEYAGSSYYLNPIEIVAGNKYIDFVDTVGTKAAIIDLGFYKSPIDLASAIETALNAVSANTHTVTFSSVTGKFTLTGGATFSLLWLTGTNNAASVGTTIGFAVAADDTGATTYTADNELSYVAPYTVDYDDATNIVVKSAELMIGSATENFCRKASTLSLSIATPVTDVDSICSDSGVLEKLILSREATMTATILLEKHEVNLFNNFIKNNRVKVAGNFGPKTGAGNWIPGKCVNFYMNNATISSHVIGGDEIITLEVSAKGYVTADKKDIHINFV